MVLESDFAKMILEEIETKDFEKSVFSVLVVIFCVLSVWLVVVVFLFQCLCLCVFWSGVSVFFFLFLLLPNNMCFLFEALKNRKK